MRTYHGTSSDRALCLAIFPLMALALTTATACGKRGAPQPPESRGPLPPTTVAARQIGSVVEVSFTVPRVRGSRPSQVLDRAELVRLAYGPGIVPPDDPGAFRRGGTVVARGGGTILAEGATATLDDSSPGALEGGGVGWTLRYGVRVSDRAGRPSALVVAPSLVFIAPLDPPSDLRAEATADGVRLVWQLSESERTSGYNVYRAIEGRPRPSTPVNRGPIQGPEFLDSETTPGATYVYFVRAVASGEPPPRESQSSNLVTILAQDRFPPVAPTGLVVVQEAATARLFWNPGLEKDLAGFRLYRREGTGEWARVGPDPVSESSFVDTTVSVGQRLEYRVAAVDKAGNEGPSSEPVTLVVVGEPPSSGEHP